MIAAALDAGALGAKINGSGGGGCMFAYAPPIPKRSPRPSPPPADGRSSSGWTRASGGTTGKGQRNDRRDSNPQNMILRMDDGQALALRRNAAHHPGPVESDGSDEAPEPPRQFGQGPPLPVDRPVEQVHLDEVQMEYLYASGDDYVFMNHETFDQIHLSAEAMGDAVSI